MAPRVAAQGLPPLAHDDRTDVAERPLPPDRLPGRRLLLGSEVPEGRAEVARGGRSETPGDLREARHPTSRAGQARRGRRRRRLRFRVRRDDVPRAALQSRDHLLLLLGGRSESPGPGQEVPRVRRPAHRQLFRGAELGRVLGRLLLLHPEGSPVPDGALDVLPDQLRQHGTVRADPHHRRGGLLRLLPRRVHRSDPRREPAARRRRRADRPRRRRDQVLDGPELVPGRQGRQGRHLQLRHQAGGLPGPPFEDLLDAGRDRARRSPGNTRAASSRGTTRSASSTRWP